MRWIKRARGKAGLAVAGMLLLLVLVVWVPVSAAGAYDRASGLATLVTGTVQATPTIDATVTALSKEQLTLQVKQLQNQLQNQNNWFFSNSTGIIAAFSAIIIALFGLYQWGENRKDERNKEEYAKNKDLKDKAEARFQAAVTGLGDEKEGAKIGAAILLRTFLRPGHEQFYTQTFDLAVANLRLPRTPHVSEDPDGIPYEPKDQETPLLLTTLSQALIVVFKEAFPLARTTIIGDKKDALQSLDATNIQLDNAYLAEADLKQVWMPQASLRKADLSYADLSGADLTSADLSYAHLREAHLRSANLREADLRGADLRGADLSYAKLFNADLTGAILSGAILSGANPEGARSLEGTKLSGVKGLGEKQLVGCELKGAIIDKDSTTSSSQSTASPSPLLPGNDAQAPLAPSAQGDLSSPDAGSGSATSSKPDPEP